MDQINYNAHKFDTRLASAMQITELNEQILRLADNALEAARKQSDRQGVKVTDNLQRTLKRVSANPGIRNSFEILRGQQIVLLVSAFETYLKDLVSILANEHSGLFKWPTPDYKINLNELADPLVSKGDVLLQAIIKQGNNFHDMQAIKRFFENYLGIQLDIDELHQHQFILATAIRHVVVHSNSEVNKDFMRNIRFLPRQMINEYEFGKPITISSDNILNTRDAFLAIKFAVEGTVQELLETQ